VKDRDIDELLGQAHVAGVPRQETLQRVAASIQGSLRPVRPLPPAWVLTACLVLVCASVALAGGFRAGFEGIDKMAPWERALVFPTLAIFVLVAAYALVKSILPGSRYLFSAGRALGLCMMALITALALSFRDYHVDHFVSAGIACLLTGLLHAIPVGLISWLLLRRGFPVSPVTAGATAGLFAGLAGVGVLELHCVNFEAAHVLVWHVAVIPVSAALGAMAAAAWHRLRTS
jgi:hypothetical protein